MNKRKITRKLMDGLIDTLDDCELDDVIAILCKVKSDNAGYDRYYLFFDGDWEYNDLLIYGERMETDEEFKSRREKERAEKKKEADKIKKQITKLENDLRRMK